MQKQNTCTPRKRSKANRWKCKARDGAVHVAQSFSLRIPSTVRLSNAWIGKSLKKGKKQFSRLALHLRKKKNSSCLMFVPRKLYHRQWKTVLKTLEQCVTPGTQKWALAYTPASIRSDFRNFDTQKSTNGDLASTCWHDSVFMSWITTT